MDLRMTIFPHGGKDSYIEEDLSGLPLLHHSGHPESSVHFKHDGTENETCNEHPWPVGSSRMGDVGVFLFLLEEPRNKASANKENPPIPSSPILSPQAFCNISLLIFDRFS